MATLRCGGYLEGLGERVVTGLSNLRCGAVALAVVQYAARVKSLKQGCEGRMVMEEIRGMHRMRFAI